MKYIAAAVAVSAMLSGCAAIESPLDDGYQFGDLTDTALTLQAQYCSQADPVRRAVALAMLKSAGAPIPSSGACADILSLVPESEIPAIDVEAAREDQERFE